MNIDWNKALLTIATGFLCWTAIEIVNIKVKILQLEGAVFTHKDASEMQKEFAELKYLIDKKVFEMSKDSPPSWFKEQISKEFLVIDNRLNRLDTLLRNECISNARKLPKL